MNAIDRLDSKIEKTKIAMTMTEFLLQEMQANSQQLDKLIGELRAIILEVEEYRNKLIAVKEVNDKEGKDGY
jgi:hypothetical protein